MNKLENRNLKDEYLAMKEKIKELNNILAMFI